MGKDTSPPRAWQRMLSGRRLDLLDPSPLDVEIEDISHGLARVARWNGQTKGKNAYSVAEHSVLVESLVGVFRPDISRKWRLAALLHDAPEYVIGDMISPFKNALGIDYNAFENKLMAAIHIRFSLPPSLPDHIKKIIKRADKASAYLEATQLAGFNEEEAAKFFGRPRGLTGDKALRLRALKPRPAAEAQKLFLNRFKQLQ